MGEAPGWSIGEEVTILVDVRTQNEAVGLMLSGKVLAISGDDEMVACSVQGRPPRELDGPERGFWFPMNKTLNRDLGPAEFFLHDSEAEYEQE